MPELNRQFAYFITPHGYGHAARAAAVMASIRAQQPGAFFDIFTRVPAWFFNMSIPGLFRYHEVLTDIGLAQTTSMAEDLAETVRRLDAFLPFAPELVKKLAQDVRALKCEMVFCDIAPLGIAVASAAGLPSVLVENFTWDWIYEGYQDEEPGFVPHIVYLQEIFGSAGTHIRTQPACSDSPPAQLTSTVVSRKPRLTRAETRSRLGINPDAPMVMITMGGILTEYPFLHRLEESKEILFLIPGGSTGYERRGNLVLIPHHSDLFHPDLVEASDAIIGKLGYSTLAEAYSAGIPYAFIPRARFRESGPMGQFARDHMNAVDLPEERFFNGDWLDLLLDLLARTKQKPAGPNGADQIASFLLG